VGKTHILHQYVNGCLPKEANATLGMEFHTKNLKLLSDPDSSHPVMYNVKLSLFDTSGEERYHAVTACHYRNAKGAIIVYDVTNRESFDNVAKWLEDARQLASKDCQIMVLGNKTDVDRFSANSRRKTSRQVSLEDGIEMAKKNQVIFYEVSAVDNINITEAMEMITK